MVKIFRKIRQRLLSENKFSRYLLYAIGEIFLVVIGILIALQINNWNESKKNQKIELRYLKELKSEFAQNLVLANESIRSNENIKASSAKMLKFTGEKRIEISEMELALTMNQSFAPNPRYIPSPSIIEDLINSGIIASINNDTLRIQLAEWFVILEFAKRKEDEIFEQRNAITELILSQIPFLNFLRDDGSGNLYEPLSIGSNFKGDTRDILNDVHFENRLGMFIILLIGGEFAYINIKEHCERILITIENELIARQKLVTKG